jgi:type VI secretion system protein ImpA
VPLARAPGIGTASLRDVLVATGKLNSPPAEGAVPLSPSDIEAAFRSTDLEELRAAESAVEKAVRLAGEIEATLTARVGASQSANLEGLVRTLEDTRGVLSLELAKRGSGDVATPASAGAGSASTRATSVPVPSGAARPGLGGIQSNEDVLRALDMVCEYFERHEPSSPVALLVRRAKRLVSKSFMEIMRDVAPDGVRQAKTILGVEDET